MSSTMRQCRQCGEWITLPSLDKNHGLLPSLDMLVWLASPQPVVLLNVPSKA
uniref:HNH endonuclease n=1 Tax=Macrostomum lignano TaxID=282301 RepID=A0A1I8IXL3_9PLAT